jgi:serralysin
MSDSLDETIRTCIDRRPPPKQSKERLALVKDSVWQPGDIIRIGFMDGDGSLQDRVRAIATTWTQYADVTFYWGAPGDADVRISFKEQGSWSAIGTQCRSFPSEGPTMNFGWLTEDSPDQEVHRVVLHEFGHALGCIHEHQNPAGGIHWNKPVVYAYYEGPPNNWSKENVDHNLFETYDKDLTVYTKVDPTSIMMYPIDVRFTTDGFSVGLNADLSAQDIEFIQKVYS